MEKLYQPGEIYVLREGKYRHIVSPEIAVKMLGPDWESFPRGYPDREMIQANLGKPITEWPEPEKPPVTIRKMSILGTCLPGCETMWEDLGGTHFYGNRYGWPDYDEVERLGMKVFINIHDDITEKGIREIVNRWKERPGCGGYWSDTAGGHEPDITNPALEQRIRFYETVRKHDPDRQNHPVMEMFDMTATGEFPPEQHQGWSLAWSDKTHDLMLVDCYPSMSQPRAEMRKSMERAFTLLINKHAHKNQVIIQMGVYRFYEPGKVRFQYDFWKEKLASLEYDNPYRGEIGVAFYDDANVRREEEMQREIKEINREVFKD